MEEVRTFVQRMRRVGGVSHRTQAEGAVCAVVQSTAGDGFLISGCSDRPQVCPELASQASLAPPYIAVAGMSSFGVVHSAQLQSCEFRSTQAPVRPVPSFHCEVCLAARFCRILAALAGGMIAGLLCSSNGWHGNQNSGENEDAIAQLAIASHQCFGVKVHSDQI